MDLDATLWLAASCRFMNNIVLAHYYANKVCKSCASLAGFVACCLADVIGFCCNLQPCMFHVASCILVASVVIGVLTPYHNCNTRTAAMWSAHLSESMTVTLCKYLEAGYQFNVWSAIINSDGNCLHRGLFAVYVHVVSARPVHEFVDSICYTITVGGLA